MRAFGTRTMNDVHILATPEGARGKFYGLPVPDLALGIIAGENKPDGVSLSVVAPCYNEAPGLCEFHRRASAACSNVATEYEIVLVNDGSRDDTWSVMSRLAASDPHVL